MMRYLAPIESQQLGFAGTTRIEFTMPPMILQVQKFRPFLSGTVLSTLLLTCSCASGPQVPQWPPQAKKWFDRAEHSYTHGDIEDARLASKNALAALPHEPKVRIVAAQIALTELEFQRAIELLQELPGSQAAGLRGRAYWYLGEMEKAAEELSVLVQDPEVRDTWAEDVLQLTRAGRGRTPFQISGGLVAAVEMPRAGSAMLVPVEVNGEPALAMIATDRAESVIDSRDQSEAAWVSLRFGGKLEVSDVPAISQDLSGLSREIGAPIKLLIGVHLLRNLNATIDLAGRQFVVRNYEPSPPPQATTLRPIYYRGGAMVLPGAFGMERTAPASSLLVNTSMAFPLALDDEGWKKAGQDVSTFVAVPGGGDLRHGVLPMLRLGAFEIPNVPGVQGAPIDAIEKELAVDLDGFAGSGLFATFRLTFAEEGRELWMEDLPLEVIEMRRGIAAEAAQKTRLLPAEGAPGVSQSAGAPAASTAPANTGRAPVKGGSSSGPKKAYP